MERMFPSGSLNQPILAPAGDVQIPEGSSTKGYFSKTTPWAISSLATVLMSVTFQPQMVYGAGVKVPT